MFLGVFIGIHLVRSALIYVVLSLCDSPMDKCPLGPLVYAREVFSPKSLKGPRRQKAACGKRIFQQQL